MARLRPGRVIAWLGAAVVVVAALSVGGAFVYIHFISGPAPAPLSLRSAGATGPSDRSSQAGPAAEPASDTSGLQGDWRVAAGSIVGYRVREVLAGQSQVAVGRTSAVGGGMTISGDTVTAASFSVLMATVHSNESERDAQFDGRIMDVSAYPTATLTLTGPISLAPLPADGVIRTYRASAGLAMHGVTRTVSFSLEAERTSAGIEVSGAIPILFADWSIANPSFPPFVTTQNHGVLEFLVKFAHLGA
jgi:polyisoprenoid-binding protein YceI